MSWLFIAIGSALGGIARHALGLVVTQKWPSVFPWGTLTINVLGSLVIGACAAFIAVSQRSGAAQVLREFVMIGFLGGFTTFSAFSLQTLQLLRDGRLPFALANIGASVVVCLLAVWLGYALAARLAGPHLA
jgi:fluoride exporter